MAKGKQAAESARRQVESLHAIVDRLTSDLAEAKIRARQAEARAADADRLREWITRHNNDRDEALDAALSTIADWKRIAKEDGERRLEALRDVGRILDDLEARQLLSTTVDRLEFAHRRYPALMRALYAGQEPRTTARLASGSARHFTDDDLKRFQRLTGQRGTATWAPDVDMADVVADLLDAEQAAFTTAEIFEYLGAAKAAS